MMYGRNIWGVTPKGCQSNSLIITPRSPNLLMRLLGVKVTIVCQGLPFYDIEVIPIVILIYDVLSYLKELLKHGIKYLGKLFLWCEITNNKYKYRLKQRPEEYIKLAVYSNRKLCRP